MDGSLVIVGLLGAGIAGIGAAFTYIITVVPVWPAHAARANKMLVGSFAEVGRFPFFGRVKTENGEFLDTDGTVVIRAMGNSLGPIGIVDGSRLVARKLQGSREGVLQAGDIVVVNAEAKGSNVRRRLRVVDKVAGGLVSFRNDPNGKPHQARPLESVEAKVTHLLT